MKYDQKITRNEFDWALDCVQTRNCRIPLETKNDRIIPGDVPVKRRVLAGLDYSEGNIEDTIGEREWVGEEGRQSEVRVEGKDITVEGRGITANWYLEEEQEGEKEKEKEKEEEMEMEKEGREEEWEKEEEEEEGEGGESISVLAPYFDLMNHDTTVNTVFELINLPKKHGFGLEMVEIETEPVLTVRYRGHGVKKGAQVSLNYRWYVILFSFFSVCFIVYLFLYFVLYFLKQFISSLSLSLFPSSSSFPSSFSSSYSLLSNSSFSSPSSFSFFSFI